VSLISYIIDLEKASNSDRADSFKASLEQCTNIAKEFDLIAVKTFNVQYQVEQLINKTYRIFGSINAIVVQESSVSSELVTTSISEAFSVALFFSEKRLEEYEISHPDEDSDVITDGEYDLGNLALEYLSLNIPTYPKLPGESGDYKEFTNSENEDNVHPFASLEDHLNKK
jgi:hypothetical protein